MREKLKACLRGQALRYPQLATALLETRDAFHDTTHWQELDGLGTGDVHRSQACLPITSFRRDAKKNFRGAEIATRFRSSGTTSTQRATSCFSPEGLLLYRLAAVSGFFSVLKTYWQDEVSAATGISLIRPNHESSLSTMVSWLGQFWPLTYTSIADLSSHLVRLDRHRPFFLWTTAGQILQLMTSIRELELPVSSIVIETGGIKNIGAKLDMDALHKRISAFHGIAKKSVVSEYSMCELATQAYRFGGRRRFIFPVWTRPRVMDNGALKNRGRGALVVCDPLRIDYPYPLQTQDLVTLGNKGDFTLRGRVASAPLRGCSLAYYDISPDFSGGLQDGGVADRHISSRESISPAQQSNYPHLSANFAGDLQEFLTRPSSLTYLRQELGSEKIAQAAIQDLLASLPQDWATALRRSFPDPRLRDWLFILPASHSLVGIYPLVFACLLGLRVSIKFPTGNKLQFLSSCIAFMQNNWAAQIEIVSSDRSCFQVPEYIDAVLGYGSDQTIDLLRRNLPVPISGFGTHDTVLVASLTQLEKFPHLFIRDAFSLSGNGCLSARMVFLVLQNDEKMTVNHIKKLQQEFFSFFSEKIGGDTYIQAMQEKARYMQTQEAEFYSPDCPVFPLLNAADFKNYEDALPRANFVLPLVIVRDLKWLYALLRRQKTIKTISQLGRVPHSEFINSRRYVRLGTSNRLIWDGTHEGKPLFQTR